MKSYLSKRNRKKQSQKTSKRHKKIEGGGRKSFMIDYLEDEDSKKNIDNDIYNIMMVGDIFKQKYKRSQRLHILQIRNRQQRQNIPNSMSVAIHPKIDLFEVGIIYIKKMHHEGLKQNRLKKLLFLPYTYYFDKCSGFGSTYFIKRIMDKYKIVIHRKPPEVTEYEDESVVQIVGDVDNPDVVTSQSDDSAVNSSTPWNLFQQFNQFSTWLTCNRSS